MDVQGDHQAFRMGAGEAVGAGGVVVGDGVGGVVEVSVSPTNSVQRPNVRHNVTTRQLVLGVGGCSYGVGAWC